MDSFDCVPRFFDGLWLPLEIAMRPGAGTFRVLEESHQLWSCVLRRSANDAHVALDVKRTRRVEVISISPWHRIVCHVSFATATVRSAL
jgi:hypothetical protein